MRFVNPFPTRPASPARKCPCGEAGKVCPVFLVLVFCILAIAAGAFWYYRTVIAHPMASDTSEKGVRLSESTRAALKRLNSPVEIRFYSLLSEAGGADSLQAFAGRVDRLLSEYKREAGRNITITRHTSRSDADLDAAASDGISAFNLDKGEPSFLGLSVAQKDQKEALPRITPEWEQALEADLTRAILRVSGAQSLAALADAAAQADPSAVEEVKRAIPNFDAVPVDQGRQILREGTLKELKTATAEMQSQIQEAQQRLSEAQTAKSEAGQKAAMKQLQQAQAAQTEKIKEITARLRSRITALERLKGVPP